MSAHCRFYPLPRPSLKSERSPRTYATTGSCSCSPPCGEVCTKANNDAPQPPSPHVHFLGLYQTYLVDYEYDRSSTVVLPNDCALPARGCPGRTYFSNTAAHVARTGRRLGRCATPGGSRANSRTRSNTHNSNLSPPPSPSLYTKHIFYPDEYPFPATSNSPSPSPRFATPALSLVPSDDSDAGLSTPPDQPSSVPMPPALSRRQTGVHVSPGTQLPIDAPGHPPIPPLMSDMFAITNALNGLDMSSFSPPSTNGLMLENASSPKKVKSKKSKSSMPRIPASSTWSVDQGVLGGF